MLLYFAHAMVLPFMNKVSSMHGSADASSLTRGMFDLEDTVSATLTLMVFLVFFDFPAPSGQS